MKTFPAVSLLGALLVGCSTAKTLNPQVVKTTFSSFDRPVGGEATKAFVKDSIIFTLLNLDDFLGVYQEISGRNVIKSPVVPSIRINFRNQAPLSRIELLQAFDSLLAQNGIAMVLSGDKSVKAVPLAAAGQEAGPVIDLPPDQLPDSGSFMVRIVHLKKMKPSELLPVVQPFAKVPGGIIAMERERVIVLRDLSSNIRQMLKFIDLAEGSGGR